MSNLPPGFRESAYRLFDLEIDHLHHTTSEWTESPIEAAFACAFVLWGRINSGDVGMFSPGWEPSTGNSLPNPTEWILAFQRQVGSYRVDFIAGANPLRPTCQVIVECDGHNFHERTKEQAARDRARDRDLQTRGFKVFRFTGAEIYRDAFRCAAEVYGELLNQLSAEDR